MMLAAVSKLKIYEGDPVFDSMMVEFDAAQQEGLLSLELDIANLEDEIRIDFMRAMEDLGYEVGYSADDEILEVWYE